MELDNSTSHATAAGYDIRYYPAFDALPAACRPLVDTIATRGLFGDPEWFAYLMRRVFDDEDVVRLYVVAEPASGRPLLLAPLRLSLADGTVPGGRSIGSINHPENYTVAELAFDPSVTDRVGVLAALFRHLRVGVPGEEPPFDAVRLWPVEDDSALADLIHTALRQAGFWVQVYANSFNQFETTAGVDHERYLSERSANHRYNVRRRQRALEKAGQLELALYRDGDLSQALDDYRAVSLASWKAAPTMFGLGTLELIDLAARKGCLRLGILRLDGLALAAQFWIVTGGVAHCTRLAYREDHKHLAAGVVLTNFMIAHALDQDRVEQIDFGYGTEDYKAGWMREARYYFGFIGFNPATRRGRLSGLKHIAGRPLKRAAKWLLNLVRRRQGDTG